MPDRKFRISSKLIIILRFKDSGTIIGTLYQNCVWKLYLDTFIVLNITSIDNKVTIRHLEPFLEPCCWHTGIGNILRFNSNNLIYLISQPHHLVGLIFRTKRYVVSVPSLSSMFLANILQSDGWVVVVVSCILLIFVNVFVTFCS